METKAQDNRPVVHTGKLPHRHGRQRYSIRPDDKDGWEASKWLSGHGVAPDVIREGPLADEWRKWQQARDKAARKFQDLFEIVKTRRCPACDQRMQDAADWVHSKLAPQGKTMPPGTVHYCPDCEINTAAIRDSGTPYGTVTVTLAAGSHADIVTQMEMKDPVNHHWIDDEGRTSDHGDYYSVMAGADFHHYREGVERLQNLLDLADEAAD